jgi:Pyocin activator protein PrtN
MNTAFLLMAQYEGKAVIPVEQVCQDYFSHLRVNQLIQKLTVGGNSNSAGANGGQPEMCKGDLPCGSRGVSRCTNGSSQKRADCNDPMTARPPLTALRQL